MADNLNYPVCGKYHINNVFGILKRHRHEMDKTDKCEFRESAFCKNLLSQKYDTWKHELKKWFITLYLYLF